MARISEDSDGWHAGGVLRRDRRALKDPRDERPTVAAPVRKKDTRRWCKGRVGREHELAWVPWAEINHRNPAACLSRGSLWVVLRCSKCLKQLESCWSSMPGNTCPRHGVVH